MRIIPFFAYILLLFTSCQWNPAPYPLPANILYFQVTKNGEQLPDSILNHIILYYYDDGRYVANPNDMDTRHPPPRMYDDTTFVFPASRYTPGLDTAGVLGSAYVPDLAIKGFTMYLKFPDGDIDTLLITAENISREQGEKDKCVCTNPIRAVQFNSKEARESTVLKAYDDKPVFVFEK